MKAGPLPWAPHSAATSENGNVCRCASTAWIQTMPSFCSRRAMGSTLYATRLRRMPTQPGRPHGAG
jgi:hypothetical protein